MSSEARTVPVRFVNDLLANLGDRPGFDPACLMRAGIAPQLLGLEGARITMEKFASLYRLIAVDMDDETPGLFSRPLRNGTLKFLCLSMLEAPNLQVALHRFTNFFRLVNDDLHFQIRPQPDTVVIALEERADLGVSRVLALELMLMLVQGVASWMIGRRIPFQRIGFAFAAPAHAAEYEHLYPGPIFFQQESTALYMDALYLHEPIRRDKAELKAFLQNAPMDWFYVSDSDRPYTYRLREYMKGRMDGTLTVNTVATAMHTSPRTLARRLAAEGGSFQSVKDKLRRDMAIEMLNKTRDPVAAIGASLGFEDATAFNRAFRQWTGSAPGAYRKKPQLAP